MWTSEQIVAGMEVATLVLTLLGIAFSHGRLTQQVKSNRENSDKQFEEIKDQVKDLRDRIWPMGPSRFPRHDR